tara:strand:- start:20352 stop:21218 length:867 start_codon:yes stop_codon:yes gene_type:complete
MRAVLAIVVAVVALVSASAASFAQAPKAVLLMAATSEAGTVVTFGRDAQESGPLSRLVRAPFEAAGMTLVSAKDIALPTGSAPPEGLPLTDQAASSIAQAAGAGVAIIVGVAAASDGKLRATALVGQQAKVRVRVLDVASGRAIFDSRGDSASYAAEAQLARSVGSTQAIAKATRGLEAKLILQWPAPNTSQGRLSVSITGAEGWRSVASILRSLAATRGVRALHALEIQPGRVVLSLESQQGAAQVVDSLRRARIHNGSLSVQLSGASLAVRVIMTSSPILPPVTNG